MFLRKYAVSLVLLLAIGAPPDLGQVRAQTPAADPMDILKLVPRDAWGFAMARSLSAIDEKAKLLNETISPNIPPVVTPMLLSSLGLGDAIDMSRPLCAVLMDVQKFGGLDRSLVALLPAKDPKAMIELLSVKDADGKSEEPEEGIYKCSLMGQPGFAAAKEKVVILGSSRDCVLKVAKTEKTLGGDFDKARISAIGKSDLYFSFSFSTVLRAYKDVVMPILQMAMMATDPEGKNTERILKMFEELSTLDIALSFDKNGLSMQFLMAPKKDSDLEKLLRDTKNTDKPLLAVLPKEKYLFALGGMANHSEHAKKFGSASPLGDTIKALQITGLDEDALEKLETGFERLAKSADAWAMCLSALPAGPDGMVGLTMVVDTGDPSGFVADIREIFKTVWAVSDDEDFQTVKSSVVHQADAETIGSIKVDTITVDLEGLAEMVDLSEDDLAEAAKVIGEGFVLRFAPADEKHVVIAFGGGKKRFESICGAVKSGKGLSTDAGITKLSNRLPSPRASEGFIALDNVGQFIKSVSKALGEEDEFPFDVPAIDAPMAFSSAQIGSIAQVNFVVPLKLITAVKEFIDTQVSAGLDDFDEDEDDDDDEDEDEDEEEGDEDRDADDEDDEI